MSYLEMNIVRFEIFMDEVTPGDLSQALLKDYLNLPTSYFKTSSAVMKYQNFLLRWGTHFIKSAKFGGSLKLSRTKVMSEKETEEQFATAAYSDMQSLLSNSFAAQSSSSQGSASLGLFTGARLQASRNTKEQENKKQSATKETSSSSKNSANEQRTAQNYANSYLSVEGGDEEIASIISDMYDPGFKSKLEAWLQSIPEYPRPFAFHLGKITELFDMNVESLFPDDTNQGCLGAAVKNDPATGKFYFESKKTVGKEIKIVKNYCKYGTSKKEFQEQFDMRRLALERAIAVYMEEGPIPSTEQLIPAGRPGCDTSFTAFDKSSFPTWENLKSGPFRVIFDMDRDITGIVASDDIVQVSLKHKRWYTQRDETVLHLYDGFDNGQSTSDLTLKRISIKGLLMTYDENNGMLRITNDDNNVMKKEGITISQKIVGRPIARVESLSKPNEDNKEDIASFKVALPCNVKWSNVHSFEPTEKGSCVKFTAASAGDIFVVFALIPSKKDTWYTVHISSDSAGVYKANKVQQMETTIISAWGLGDSNLFQTYSVCLTKTKDTLHIQYGKVIENEDKMTVYLDYKDTSDPILPEFYAFGSGMRDVQLVQISILPKASMGQVECGADGSGSKEKDCFKCHPQCINGCFKRQSDKACRACRSLTVNLVDGSKQCVEKCPGGTKEVNKVCKIQAKVKTEVKENNKECKADTLGKGYQGKLSITKSGKTCQRWDTQSPHKPNHDIKPSNFPEDTLKDAENYCRNPDNAQEGPWCYTTDINKKWEYCYVQKCVACDNLKGLLPDIPSDRLTASSFWVSAEPNQGRLDTKGTSSKSGGWLARSGKINTNQWIQVDLGRVMKFLGVITQGRNGVDQWVKTFRIDYSTDGEQFITILHSAGQRTTEFQGNSDQNTKVRHMLDRPRQARYVRINPRTWNSYPSMRFDVIGCDN
ncbi:unnamed protein product [Owenia fusiformis]|nr:unnamed protein product [Owenia fusiformis]